jgi:hypothetical protein
VEEKLKKISILIAIVFITASIPVIAQEGKPSIFPQEIMKIDSILSDIQITVFDRQGVLQQWGSPLEQVEPARKVLRYHISAMPDTNFVRGGFDYYYSNIRWLGNRDISGNFYENKYGHFQSRVEFGFATPLKENPSMSLLSYYIEITVSNSEINMLHLDRLAKEMGYTIDGYPEITIYKKRVGTNPNIIPDWVLN